MTLKELFNKYYYENTNERGLGFFIDFFETNQSLISNADISSDIETYNMVTILMSDYADCLVGKESYSKALLFLDRAITLWENKPDMGRITKSGFNWYEILLFDRARANYFKKNIAKSIKDLVWLTQNYPENEKYLKWLIGARNHRIRQVENILFTFWAIGLCIEVYLPHKYYAFKGGLLLFSLITMVSALILLLIRKLRIWRMERKN